jgi:hypothetical protein
MDRRRFVPSAEGLEGRALLANSGVASIFSFTKPNNNSTDTVPMTFTLKQHRIQRVPYYMSQIRSGRFLPNATLKELQADLLAVTTKTHAPGATASNGYQVLNDYNTQLRAVNSHASLSVQDVKTLTSSFDNVLTAAGATPEAIANLNDDMTALAKNDVNSPQPVFLATNDFTLVLQTVLGIGRPIRRPESAELAAGNGKRVGRNFGVAPKDQPTVVGTYDAYSQVQIVNHNLDVFGTSYVKKVGATQSNGEANATGKYAITFNQPLPNGLYTFYIRAIDQYGNTSHISPPFKIKINTDLIPTKAADVPGGPLGMTS